MRLRALFIGLLTMVSVGSIDAKTVKYTIPLIHPEHASEMSDKGWVEYWTEVTMPDGMVFRLTQFNPETGQIRVDCNYGCWDSNFGISNVTPFKGAITRVELVYTSGELDPEHVLFETKTGNFPVFYGDYKAKVDSGMLYWEEDWHGKKNKFHIEVESTEAKNTTMVIVSEINVYYNRSVRCDTDGPAVEEADDEEEAEEPQPEDPKPEEPEPPIIGDPEPEPIVEPRVEEPVTEWNNGNNPQQPQLPQQDLVEPDEPEELTTDTLDPTQPVPPGTIRVCKKNLLEPLTEEEFLQIRAKNLPFGEECEKAARDWVKHIPDIKAAMPEACLAELRTMTYNDYLQFVHGLLESMAVDFVNIASMTDKDYDKKEEEFLRQTVDKLIVLGPEWVRLYNIKEPDINGKMKEYCKKYIKLSVTAQKYPKLYQYLIF